MARAKLLRALAWPFSRLREGYGLRDLPSLASARLRGLSPHAWEERLNEWEAGRAAEVMRSTPRTLFLEITGRCPIVCLMCARRYRKWDYGDLRLEVFERLVPVLPRVGVVVLGGFGEPLVAEHFDEMLRRLSSLGARVALQTSGYQLTEERAQHLVASGLQHLHISVDSPEEATYASIRPRIVLSDVTSRVRQISRLRREAGTPYPSIHVVFVAMRRNIEQLPAMIDLAADMGADKLTVQYMVVHGEELRGESLFYDQQLAGQMFDATEERARAVGLDLELPERFGMARSEAAGRCTDPWKVMFVRWNGEVHPCCYAPSTVVMGDLSESDFWSVWNGTAYRELRRRVNSGDPPDFCRSCTAGRVCGVDDERAHIVLAAPE